MDLRTDGACRILLLREEVGRHDHIGIDRPEGNRQLTGGTAPPPFRLPHRILIANDEGGAHLGAKSEQIVGWVRSEDEVRSPLLDAPPRLLQPLDQEGVMAQVCPGVLRMEPKEDEHRSPQQIPSFNRQIERRVVQSPLCPLHPVDDAPAIRGRLARPANRHARVNHQSI